MRQSNCRATDEKRGIMPYSTYEELVKASSEDDVIQLSDDNCDGIADAGVVTEAISKADAIIDSYIGGRYVTPLSTVPLIIGDISTQLAIYFLWERRHRQDMPQSLMEIYKNLIARLKSVHDGQIDLPIMPKGDGTPGGGGQTRCNKTPANRLFPWSVLDKW